MQGDFFMGDRDQFLTGLQNYLQGANSVLKLPEHLHTGDYVYNSFKEENVEFSVGCDSTGYTVRFLLLGPMLKHLDKVHKQISINLGSALVSPDEIAPPLRIPGGARATVIIDCSKRDISNKANWPSLYAQIDKYLSLLWNYFVSNRSKFRRGVI